MIGLLRTTVVLLAVFSSACLESMPSSFCRNFSLRQVIDNNKSQLHVDCESSNGGDGIAAGGGGSGFKVGSLTKNGNYSFVTSAKFICKVDSNGFDEAIAIPLLQRAVEQSISASGAKVTNRESADAEQFALRYTVNGAEGKLTVSARRFSGEQYSFHSNLEESRK